MRKKEKNHLMNEPTVTGLASAYHHIIILALFTKFYVYR